MHNRTGRYHLLLAILTLAVLCAPAAVHAQGAGNFLWLEGETPTRANVKIESSAWGHKEFFSNGAWGQVSMDADKVDTALPNGGAILAYDFTAAQPAKYELWNRIGYEFARSPFAWRLDGGAWTTVSPDALTTDLMEFETWNELAWLKLGDSQLSVGPHTLEIRLTKTLDDKGKPTRILYASDALCLTPFSFHPNSKFKPGEIGRDAQDDAAANHVFALADGKTAGARASVSLSGQWEICRNDEQTPPADVAVPMTDFPAVPHWKAIAVPGDKGELRPELLLAHRVWYRTKIQVPATLAGRSFFVTFPQNNLNTTVYVNGVLCGFGKNPFARFDVDITKGVKAGQVNELRVGIRDAWYGYSTNPRDPMKLRRKFNLPLSVVNSGFQDLAYPIWHGFQSGILAAPTLSVAGPAYASDVFVKPSVARKTLSADVTLSNPSARPVSGEVVCEAVNPKTGNVEKTLAAQAFSLMAGGHKTVTLTGGWTNPKLWWPDPNAQLYDLRTTTKLEGKVADISHTTFGFREWGARGKDFTLNGIPWHLWADLGAGATPATWLAHYRRTNQRTMRLMGIAQQGLRWMGLTPDEALEFFDRNGVAVRRCGPLDGEAIGYNAIENDPDLQKLYGSPIKMDLMQNWRDQMAAQVRGERNHPSIQLWSIENEWLYINCINLFADKMDEFEREAKKCADAVRAVDPTRLTMTDGGGANKNQTMPVHGNHYVFDPGDTRYPALAYETNPTGGGRGRWTWDAQRPRFIGEDFFATGINPADYALFGGEAAFGGKTQARPAAGIVYRMLTEGYRWAGQSAWQFWLGDGTAENPYVSNASRAVFCRQWNWTFGAGQKVPRTFALFNDTHDSRPLQFTWILTFGGKTVARQTTLRRVAPGTRQILAVRLPMPAAARRAEGRLILTLAVGGKDVFRDVKSVSVLPTAFAPAPAFLLLDPRQTIAPFLQSRRVRFTRVVSLARLPATGKTLLVAPDALTEQDSASSRLAAWAAPGRTVIVLEQTHPLKYQGLPADMETTETNGQIAFGEDLTHPILHGLGQRDFWMWGTDGIVYKNAYAKPTRGGKSLAQCAGRLADTALVEVPAGKGLLLLCQLTVGKNLAANAVAQRLLVNLMEYGAAYKQTFRPVIAVTDGDLSLQHALDAVGVTYTKADDPLAALSEPNAQIAVIAATPANLKRLAANGPKLKAWTARGGYLLLHGLTPDGLDDYNKVVGFDHMIRPFRRERVAFPPRKDPLTSGLTTGDIVLLSGERIFDYTSDEYVADNIFTFCVDYDDVAPFAESGDFRYVNAVNNFVSADGWKLINNFPAKNNRFTFRLFKPQTITEFTWVGNTLYNPTTRVNLTFDGGQKASFKAEPTSEPQLFAVSPPRAGQSITLEQAENADLPGKNQTIGLDNIYLKAKRPADFYQNVRPLLNVGGLMHYPRGPGGIVLCNLDFLDREAVPVNAVKKRTIFAAILRNLQAPFSSAASVIAGANLSYAPIDIGPSANVFRDERGWFGDKAFTFAALPTGTQTFAGVPFQIYDFQTSPVPNAIGLDKTDAVRGVIVHRKADALFFLQTARLDARRSAGEIRDGKQYQMARYVVHYADGQSVAVPIYAEINVGDFKQKTPTALPGAQIAWTRPYAGTEFSAVAYSQQWNNPRPNVEIAAIDFELGPDRRGFPVLLALTAATAR